MRDSMKSPTIIFLFHSCFLSISSPLEPSFMLNFYSPNQPYPPPSQPCNQKSWKYLFAICTQDTSLAHQQGAHQARICISYWICSRKVYPGETGRILSSGTSMWGYCPAIRYFLKGLGHHGMVGWACRENMGLIYLQWLKWASLVSNSRSSSNKDF